MKRATKAGDLAMNRRSWADAVLHYEQAISLYDKSSTAGTSIDFTTMVRRLAEALRFTRNIDAALRRAEQATALASKLDHSKSGVSAEHGACLLVLGKSFGDHGRYSQAIDAVLNAIVQIEAANDTHGTILALLELGEMYPLTGRMQDALEVLVRAESLIEAEPVAQNLRIALMC